MPAGGPRPGAGRPFGSKDALSRSGSLRRRQLEELSVQVSQFLRTNDEGIFEGDSLELAISIYKNEDLPIPLRIHALALAIPYERPRLVATASVTKHIEGSDEEFGRLFQAIEQRLLSAPEKRDEIVDLLRDGDAEIRTLNGHNQSQSG
jgi:hypothetical protein